MAIFLFLLELGLLSPEQTLAFLGVVFSWPVVTMVLGSIFLVLFSDPLEKFIRNMSIRYGDLVVTQSESTSNIAQDTDAEREVKSLKARLLDIQGDRDKSSEIISLQEEVINSLFEIAEYNNNKYLSLRLVKNTKYALLWLHLKACTKDYFDEFLPLQDPAPERSIEVVAIFNVLSFESLIEQDLSGVLKITEKGIGFLRFLGLI